MRHLFIVTAIAALGLVGCQQTKVQPTPTPPPPADTEMTGVPTDSRVTTPPITPTPTPITQAPTPVTTGGKTYTVQPKDTLYSIAKTQLGSGKRVKDIMAINPEITDASKLKIGQVIKLPEK